MALVGCDALGDYGRAGTYILWKIRKGPCINISDLHIRSCAFRDIVRKPFFGSDGSYNHIILSVYGDMAVCDY
jgi:hypothetical protein